MAIKKNYMAKKNQEKRKESSEALETCSSDNKTPSTIKKISTR
jgi:hypothetical protein